MREVPEALSSVNGIQSGADYFKSQLNAAHATADTSDIIYTIVDETIFSTAHVRIGGTAYMFINGRKQPTPFTGMGTLVTLHSRDLLRGIVNGTGGRAGIICRLGNRSHHPIQVLFLRNSASIIDGCADRLNGFANAKDFLEHRA